MNKDILKAQVGSPGTQDLTFGKRSHIRWDIPAGQIVSEMQSVQEYAQNEQNRAMLAEAAYAYMNLQSDFIADKAAPFYPVSSLIGKYRKYNERTFYDRPETSRGKDSPPAKFDFGSAFENYDLTGRALAAYLSAVDRDDAINQYGSVDRWRSVVTQQLTHLLLLDRELTVASLLQTSGNYASASYYTTASPLWSDASADYISDVMTGEDALLASRDVLIMGHDVFRQCQKSPQIQGASTVSAMRKGQTYPYVNMQAIENYFDSPVVVGRARYNSDPEASSPTLSRIWANYVIIMHNGGQVGSPELATPFVRSFKLQSTSFPNVGGWTVKTVRDDSTIAGGEILMVGYWSQEKVFANKAGYQLKAL